MKLYRVEVKAKVGPVVAEVSGRGGLWHPKLTRRVHVSSLNHFQEI